MEILKYINISDINSVTRVCKYLWSLISHDDFWRRKFVYDYEFNDYILDMTFKDNYKQLVLLDQIIKHFWVNRTSVSVKRKPNKNLTIPLASKPHFDSNMDRYHANKISEGRCWAGCLDVNAKPNLWNWLMDQLYDGKEKGFNAGHISFLNSCPIPPRRGDAVEDMTGCGATEFYNGIDFISGFNMDIVQSYMVGVPTKIDMFWPAYRIDYFSDCCPFVPFRLEYFTPFKINKTYGIPPLTWKNGNTVTEDWHYSWITIANTTLYLILNLKDFSLRSLTPALFDSIIDQMGCCDSLCQQYKYIELNHLDLQEQNLVVHVDDDMFE